MLPLFPLSTVLFPGGKLSLKIFEARYLDLLSLCMREGKPFGVVALRAGGEVQQRGSEVALMSAGTLAQVVDVDMPQAGLMVVTARGAQRFELSNAHQSQQGLWMADTSMVQDDAAHAPNPDHAEGVDALQRVMVQLRQRRALAASDETFKDRFDDAGWVANRWSELLPLNAAAKQALMMLPSPVERLDLVCQYLRDKGVLEALKQDP
jgi:uncharacterized protein